MSMKFKSDIEVQAGLRDSSGSLGTSGQILSSTSGNVSWVTPTVNTVASDVQNQVKAGVAINKGQAVYVTGADGTNIIVGLASNTSEATSSKTLGLLNATVAINGFADVVQIGRLAGLNTIGAVEGDPVWLGTNGNLIYGLTNKPYAPAHLVFLGIVTRVNANNGEIFVNVQNGFELKEIHDVDIITNVPINGDVLGYDGTLWVNKTIAGWLGYTPANANGTTNYVSKFTSATTLGDSQIFDNGTNVGIGTTSPGAKLHVTGEGIFDDNTYGRLTLGFASSQNDIYSTTTGFGAWKNFRLNANELIFSSGGTTERMRITSSGNVGIGTSSPSSKLTVSANDVFNQDSSGQIIITGASDQNKTLSFGFDTTSNYGYIQSIWRGNSLKPLVLQPWGGNVGIGTTSPVSISNYTTLDLRGTNGSLLYMGQAGVTASLRLIGEGTDGYIDNLNSTGSLLFRTNNATERMRITSSGNVGIGTSSPSTKLDINGNARVYGANLLLDFTGNVGGIQWGLNPYIQGIANGGFEIRDNTSGLSRFVISSSGNVGIGTTSPGSRLTVQTTTSSSADTLRITDGTGTINIGHWDAVTNRFEYSGRSTYHVQYGASNYFAIGTNGSERMRITSAGNVGIGTTSPNARFTTLTNAAGWAGWIENQDTSGNGSGLVVTGASNSGGISFFVRKQDGTGTFAVLGNGNVGIGTTSPATLLDLYKASFPVAQISSGTITGNMGIDTSNNFMNFGTTTNHDVSFATNNAPRMRITNTGNVGIGTTSPGSKLTIADSVNGGSGAIVTNNNTGSSAYGYVAAYSPDGGIELRAYPTANALGKHTRVESTSGNTSGLLINQAGANPISFWNNGSEKMRIASGGNIGIGTTSPSYPLHVSAQVSNVSIYADYDIVAYSDQSVKENIRPIDNALERVIESRGVLYDRIDSGEKDNIGFIAQELEVAFPELVVTNPDGTKAVKYQNAVAVLFEAVKEQQKQIDEIKRILNGLTN